MEAQATDTSQGVKELHADEGRSHRAWDLEPHYPLDPVYSVQSILGCQRLFSQAGGRWGQEGDVGPHGFTMTRLMKQVPRERGP